jgi:hypothetical protein
MAMFRAYFDASGKENLGIVTVAGWLAAARSWAAFQERWNAVLSAARVPYFRMSEFAHSTGAYKDGWKNDESRRRKLISDLAQVLKDTVEYGVSCSLRYADFKNVDLQYKLTERYGNAYVFAAQDCIARINGHLSKAHPEARRGDVSYIFERGDDGAGHLVRLAEEAGMPIPEFHPSITTTRGGVGAIQLQAADFAAYETYRLGQQYAQFEGRGVPVDEMRMPARLLLAIPHHWGIYNSEKLQITLKNIGSISRRN